MKKARQPDVAIVGGGIAGTLLARQLRRRLPDLRITVFERGSRASFKVGESTVEIAEYDPPRAFALKVVDGALPLDGAWTLEPGPASTRLHFVGEGSTRGLLRPLDGMFSRAVARQFARHHRQLKAALEAQ